MDDKLLQKLSAIEQRYQEISKLMADPTITTNREKYRKLSKEYAAIKEIVEEYRHLKTILEELASHRQLIEENEDPELTEMAKNEIPNLEANQQTIENKIKVLLLPKDPADEKNVILEIRAGTGGDEAALFAADLFRMYQRYVETNCWRLEVLSLSSTGKGGYKEIIALVEGDGVYSHLKYESGVHRVQRVPETETQGRIHTSAVTVAILPEADEVDVKIDEKDLRIDVFRSSGPGGQSVNTTDSAVRITHLPSNLVVTCQDEKSQHKNKAKALKILTARLLDLEREKQQSQRSQSRKSQVGSGDRSERIRTYNFPQGRVTDHRIGLTLYKLEQILEGQLELVIPELRAYFQAEALREQ